MTTFSDPGIPKEVYHMKARPKERHPNHSLPQIDSQGNKLCSECYVYLGSNLSHCVECDVCIHEINNHCYFYGKCIGKGNKTYWLIS